MPQARRIQGEVVFPANATPAIAERVVVELRDVAWMDQPSRVLCATVLQGVAIGPGVRLPFALEAPSGQRADSLSLRVQVDLRGTVHRGAGGAGGAGDYLTTASQPVAPTGDVRGLVVPVTRL